MEPSGPAHPHPHPPPPTPGRRSTITSAPAQGYDRSGNIPPPTNSLVTPLLTDLYQLTMAYAYWKSDRHADPAVFELFFRKNPFGGEYTVFAGLDEVIKFLANFRFSASDLDYLRSCPALAHCEAAFFDEYLANLSCADVRVMALREGSLCFPRVPMLIVEGPLGITQLVETTLLCLVNYPSLIATNAARMVVAARGTGKHDEVAGLSEGGLSGSVRAGRAEVAAALLATAKLPKLVEFGLRRAQGPDGGFSASKYAYVGGFDGTSNVQAGKWLDVPIAGTHAHSFVQAHSSLEEARGMTLDSKDGTQVGIDLLEAVLKYRNDVLGDPWTSTNDSELAAFISYACSFPDKFLCLIDTYDTLRSGLRNFILVSLVLDDLGYVPTGVRLDSGDLAFLSMECERTFLDLADELDRDFLRDIDIVASNDINENVLHSLNKQGHRITVFGIGTNLVTCQAQPALGCVYKLVELNGKPRIKLSQDLVKVLIPGRKMAYRLYGEKGWPLLDVMVGVGDGGTREGDPVPTEGQRMLCRHPFVEQKRVAVTAKRVERLHHVVFDGRNGGAIGPQSTLAEAKQYVAEQLKAMRPDILRHVNPAEYKVSVSDGLFKFLHHLWQTETPVVELA